MKLLPSLLVMSSVTVMLSVTSPVAHADDNISQRVCEYISVDDKARLRKFLKNNNLHLKNAYKSITCNGMNILVFAAKSNALDTGELIISQIPSSAVTENLDAVKSASAHLGAVADARVAG